MILFTTLPVRLDSGETVDLSADRQMSEAIRQSPRALVEHYRQDTAYRLPTSACLLTATAE